jgi:oligopeptidase A
MEVPIPFDTIKPEHVGPGIRTLIESARARIEEIAAAGIARSYENTLAALDHATDPLDLAVGVVRHLEGVVTSDALRDAWNEVQPDVIGFYSTIPLHGGLWQAIKEYAATEEARALTGVRKRYLEKTLDSFRRHGADLDPEGKQTLEALDVELAGITTKFVQNVVDATAGWEYWIEEEARLSGLPESARAAARQSAEAKQKGGWRFTLQQPSYLAVMTYLDDASIRETFYRAYNARAAQENSMLIPRILELRAKKAQLLGFADFADFVLADRMAKKGATAQAFVSSLTEKTEAQFQRENAQLAGFMRARTGTQVEMKPWDVAYWAEKQREAEYAFNEEDLRPYFPLDHVVEGLFELVGRLFGATVAEAPGVPVWHEDVKHYEIRDGDGTVLGTFFADWFPRETKRGGAWMDAFVTGEQIGPVWKPHIGLMCGNLTPPLPGKPSLLTHREVETVFHEFGHLIHHCLSRVEVKGLSGTNVAWDFVELPSQIMENWCWERESLDLFASHWQTGGSVPEELFQKMLRARTFRGANAQMRQLGFGMVDLTLHIGYDPARDGEPVEYSNRLLARFTPAPLPDGYAMIAGFTHLFADPAGYGAAYYSYKWAEVLDADAFTRFRAEGIFNQQTGRAFRDCVLSKGDSEDPAELFRRFMGRDPDPSALLERLGIAA